MRKLLASILALVGLSAGVSLYSPASLAVATNTGPCYEQVQYEMYRWKRVTPAVPEVKEYRWHRSYTGPKEIENFSYQGGKWVPTPGVWGAVPDSLNPPSNLVAGQTGTFSGNNKPYGLPNSPYSIKWRYQAGGEEWWPSQNGWATSLNGAPQGAWGNPVAQRVKPGTGTPEVVEWHPSKDGWSATPPTGDGWDQVASKTFTKNGERIPCSDKPQDDVDRREVTLPCEAPGQTEVDRISYETPFTWEYNYDNEEWDKVPGTEVEVNRVKVPLSEEDQETCRPVKENKVVVTEGTPECGDTEVAVTTETTVYSYEYDAEEREWVESSETTTEATSRPLTEEEQAVLNEECWVCVDVNTGTLEQLVTLNGVAEVIAQLIIDNRPYYSLEDLVEKVDGIGPVNVQKFADDLCPFPEPPVTTEPPVPTTEPPVPTTEPPAPTPTPEPTTTTTVVVPPVTTVPPTPTPAPTTTVPVIPAPTTTVPVSVGTAPVPTPTPAPTVPVDLPNTGSNTTGIVLFALVLILFGGALLAVTRRK